MKLSYCYKRSISLSFQVPNRSAPKCWNYVEVELAKNAMIHSTVHRKVLSLIIHIADFDWTLIYRRHELSLPINRVCTGQSADSERARDQWQCAALTQQVNLSFWFVYCVSKHLIECIAIER